MSVTHKVKLNSPLEVDGDRELGGRGDEEGVQMGIGCVERGKGKGWELERKLAVEGGMSDGFS